MTLGSRRITSDFGETKSFRSTRSPSSQRKAVIKKPQSGLDIPTICDKELMAKALEHVSPGRTPRSFILPFFQRNAWWASSPAKSAWPTTSPASLSQLPAPLVPPRVPRSVRVARSQKNGCAAVSPARFEDPASWPRLLGATGRPKVPPRVPTSIILPFSHRNGSMVASPVVGFGVQFVYDPPDT